MPTVTEIEQQLELAKVAEKQAAVAAVEHRKKSERELHEVERGASNELRGLTAQADRVFAAKATMTGRPAPEIRGLARQFLHGGLDIFSVEALANSDPTFGGRFGVSRMAGRLLIRFADIGVSSEALWSAADQIEARAWSLAIDRARELGGEA
jgi:hypothetical protein